LLKNDIIIIDNGMVKYKNRQVPPPQRDRKTWRNASHRRGRRRYLLFNFFLCVLRVSAVN